MKRRVSYFIVFLLNFAAITSIFTDSPLTRAEEEKTKKIMLYWWQPNNGEKNFGDELSRVLIKRMCPNAELIPPTPNQKKFLAIGSVLHFAEDGDIVWGSGINGKHMKREEYHFTKLNVKAVRGPLTRQFLLSMNINCPPVYGDPALLFPKFFPEFRPHPIRDYIVIPHISEMALFHDSEKEHLVLPTEEWSKVVQKIVESRLVISSSLHGLIIAEAFGIPARLLRITENEPMFKYQDYYLGTGRASCTPASSVEEALRLGGEPLPQLNLIPLLQAFPRNL